MKKNLFLVIILTLLCAMQARADVEINENNFPDAKFRNYLLNQSYGSDGVITNEEISTIKTISFDYGNIIRKQKMERWGIWIENQRVKKTLRSG